MSKQALRAVWQQRVEQHQASGLSIKQFAEHNARNYHQFCYWRKKFADEQQVASTAGFARVTRQHDSAAGQSTGHGLCIHLAGGLSITGIGHDNLGVLLSLLRQL